MPEDHAPKASAPGRSASSPPTPGQPRTGLPTAIWADRLAILAEVVGPTLAKGPLIRQRRVTGLIARLGLEARGVRRMERLRDRYGAGLLLVPLPGRLHILVLSPGDAARILHDTPVPFSPATNEKRRALAHFEPDVSLISTGEARLERRRLNEEALDTGRAVHSMAGPLLAAAEEEAQRLLAEAGGRLDYARFTAAWHAMARRVVLGNGARDDEPLTNLLARLRGRANWVMLARRRRSLIEQLRAGVGAHLARAEPGSLAARIAARPKSAEAAPEGQVIHYLFAFDAAGIAVFRALALLVGHPEALAAARAEALAVPGEMRPRLRAAILESVRLWSTTPAILRQATREVNWGQGIVPAGASLVIYAPFLHRDPALPFADRFAPELWLDGGQGVRTAVEGVMEGSAEGPLALVPFSLGPGLCPAANLVPMLGSAFLARLMIAGPEVRLAEPGGLRRDRPLPGALDPFTLAFALDPA